MRLALSNMFKLSGKYFTDRTRRYFFCGSLLLFLFRVCHAVLSVPCSLVATCWETADLLALLCVMFSCVFVTFPYGVFGQVWYLIVSIPDLCLLPYFVRNVGYLRQEEGERIIRLSTVYR